MAMLRSKDLLKEISLSRNRRLPADGLHLLVEYDPGVQALDEKKYIETVGDDQTVVQYQ